MTQQADTSMHTFLEEWNSPEPYVTAHTSGSTGVPKAIRLLKSDMVESARATLQFFGITPGQRLHCPLSPEYIAAKMMAVRAIVGNCRLTTETPSRQPLATDTDPSPIALLPIVPMQAEWMASHPEYAARVRNLLVGGAPMTPDAERALINAGYNAWASYGMTETCSHVALRRLGNDGTFTAMPGITFCTDADGCLTICSDRFSWRTLATNDTVELLSPTLFRWLGRRDNIINSGGIKIIPEAIERILSPHITEEFYLCGETDPDLGTALVMHIEGRGIDTAALDELCHRVLPRHHVPRRIYVHESLARTQSGKLRRNDS